MKIKTLPALLAGLIALSFVASACTPPPILIKQDIQNEKAVQSFLRLSHSSDEKKLYNYYFRVCDYNPQDQMANCVDSLVLANVHAGSVY